MNITESISTPFVTKKVRTMTAGQARLRMIDATKGIAIILVVFGHLWSGLIDAQIAPDTAWSQFIFDWIYSFHMPVFFFIAGLFAVSSAEKRSTGQFIKLKLKTILYPFALWSLLQISVESLMANHLNNPPTFTFEFLLQSFVLYPYRNMWFLFHFFIVLMLFILLYHSRVRLWGFTLFAVAFFLLGTRSDQFVLYLSARFIPFFLMGIFLATPVRKQFQKLSTGKTLVMTTATFALLTVLVLLGIDHSHPAYLLPAALGILGTLGLGHVLTTTKQGELAILCGTYSLEIYLTHIFTSSGTRIIIQRYLGWDVHWSLHAVFGLIIGIAGALLLVKLLERLKFDYAFRLP